ncbi:phage/plasmid replication protein [Pseudogulbenkiania sp. MAI-1]|uniref:phage/plasmid replication domain-containing protein n=1 Tax=Pseudogulbenkiania sp. MAI-1 TaxID=990370 RepID=UPI00045E5DA8|nr:phage/plasmid replication protein [Pseudogulbenkiania sp. MAI-1]
MQGVFVDFIRISQSHQLRFDLDTNEFEKLPMVDSGWVCKYARNEAGEFEEFEDGTLKPEYISVSRRHFEGSFDSLYIVRCDGRRVEFEGNVGRFGRPDNLFNLDFDATLDRINRILAELGLPPFTAGEEVAKQDPSDYDIKTGQITEWTGASVSTLHLTRNYATGSAANAQAMIDWLATQSLSKVKRGRAGETTVVWGTKGGRKYLKAYLKAPEMLVHRHGRPRSEIESDPVYQFCNQQGIVRLELEASRLMLRDNSLRFLGDITMTKLVNLFAGEVDPLLARTKADVTRFQLEDLPAPVRVTAAAFLRGENVRALMSRATFFRHAKSLRDYGLDISEPLPTLHKFSTVIKVVEITPLVDAPAWYWDHQRKLSLQAVQKAEQAAQQAA